MVNSLTQIATKSGAPAGSVSTFFAIADICSDDLGKGSYPTYTVTWTQTVWHKVVKERYRGGYTTYEYLPFEVKYCVSYYFTLTDDGACQVLRRSTKGLVG